VCIRSAVGDDDQDAVRVDALERRFVLVLGQLRRGSCTSDYEFRVHVSERDYPSIWEDGELQHVAWPGLREASRDRGLEVLQSAVRQDFAHWAGDDEHT